MTDSGVSGTGEGFEAGRDFQIGTLRRVFWYAAFAGPATGALLLLPVLLAIGFYEASHGELHNQPFAFLPIFLLILFFFPVGIGPAVITAILLTRKFFKNRELRTGCVLKSSLYGSVSGAIIIGIIWIGAKAAGWDLLLNSKGIIGLCTGILIVGPASAWILWHKRPRNWIGPLTRQELEDWRKNRGGKKNK